MSARSEYGTMPRLDRGRYANPPGGPAPDCGPADLSGFIWRRMLDRGQPAVPSGHCRTPEQVRAGLEAHAGRDSLTWLGHAAFLLQWGGHNILTDPFLSDVAAPAPMRQPRRFVPPALRVSELPPIDLLLVSHSHYDHLDAPTIAGLPGKSRVDVTVPVGLGDFFRRHGYTSVHELLWWQSVTLNGLRVTAVPAIHFSRRGLFDRNRALWCGFVVDDGTRHCYFVGDTAYAPVLGEIGAAFGAIDTVLVPIGAYAPRAIMAGAHVDPEEAAALCTATNVRRAVAMHWGTIVLTDEPPFEPPQRWREAMREEGFDERDALVPAIGQTLPLWT